MDGDEDQEHSVDIKIRVVAGIDGVEIFEKLTYTEGEGLEAALERRKQQFMDDCVNVSVRLPA